MTFEKIFQLNNIEIHLDVFLKYYVPINLNYWKLYREEKIDKKALRFARLNDVFSILNYKIDDALIHKLSDDYIKYLATFNFLIDGTFEILDYLKEKYRIHIITNGFEEVQQAKLDNSNISHYFETVTNSEMVGVKKPNPKIFNYAVNAANTIVERSVMIGDNYEADVIGAINVGIESVFFDVCNSMCSPEIKRINSLKALKKIL